MKLSSKQAATKTDQTGWYKTSVLLSTIGMGQYSKKKSQENYQNVINNADNSISESKKAISKSEDILQQAKNSIP